MNTKKGLSVAALLGLAIGMAAGCSTNSDKNTASVTDASIKPYYKLTGNEKDKDITVSWCLIGGRDEYRQHYWSEMKGLQAIQKNTGVNIDFQVKISYDDYLPMFTAKNYPDVITANNLSKYPGRMAGMYNDNVSVRLNEYMKDWMPNFSKIVKDYPRIGQDLRLDDGSYTYVAALYDINDKEDRIAASRFGLAIRKDWLDVVGMDVPTTIDEWHDALLAFKTDDPNGDGQNNEEPICLASSCWKYFLTAYGIDDDPSIEVDEDGNEHVIYGYISDGYRQYLTEFRKWYTEGLIYNMFENTSVEKREERILGNYAGAWKGEAHMFDEDNASSYINKLREIVPEAEFAACPWPKLSEDSKQWCFSDINSFSTDSTVITNKAVADGHDKAAAYLIDYMLGENGSTLLTWGIEGESFEVGKDGKKVLKDGMDKMVEFYDTTIPTKYTYADPLSVMLPQFKEVSEYMLANQSKSYTDACKTWAQGDTSYKMNAACQLSVEQINEVNELEDKVKDYIRKMRYRFITGIAPLTEYDTYVAQVKTLGGDKYLDTWATAYENYKKR